MAKAKKLPAAWYVETTADGGAHYGRQSGQVVEALCGRKFEPLDYATRKGTVIRWTEPVDEAHACPDCWSKFEWATEQAAKVREMHATGSKS